MYATRKLCSAPAGAAGNLSCELTAGEAKRD